jgi:D-beta-D-heptose 7-phosphate kinase/D-beta-D-heptose 1-phosphate adenosyltransferase
MWTYKRIFVNGCFDILHLGHLELLQYAKNQGSYLLVAIDSDRRIREKKGQDRPFNNQNTRKHVMAMLKPVDEVKIFDTDQELIDIVADYRPDIMIVGSDWENKPIIGSEYSKSIMFFNRIGNESTTQTIENYIDRRYLHR